MSGPGQPVLIPSPVLIVEDDINVAFGLSAILEIEGATVYCVHSGAAAIAAVAELQPAAIILDMRLPDMTGLELYHRLSDQIRTIPVIFSTGQADHSMIEPLRAAGGLVCLLQKPYSIETLVAALSDLAKLKK